MSPLYGLAELIWPVLESAVIRNGLPSIVELRMQKRADVSEAIILFVTGGAFMGPIRLKNVSADYLRLSHGTIMARYPVNPLLLDDVLVDRHPYPQLRYQPQ